MIRVLTSTAEDLKFDIKPTAISVATELLTDNEITSKYVVPTEVENIIRNHADELSSESSIIKGSINDENDEYTVAATEILDKSKHFITNTLYTTYTYYTTVFADGETDLMSRTEIVTNYQTQTAQLKKTHHHHVVDDDDEPRTINQEPQSTITLVTDVSSSISSHDIVQTLIQVINVSKQQQQQNETIIHYDNDDDQISSESNHDEIFPSATLLLQTSYTTYTYYTTMYSGNLTNIASSLDTVTNIVTETLQEQQSQQPQFTINTNMPDINQTLPITYFTTFTYWTKLARDGELTTVSREETISNIIEPTILTTQTLATAIEPTTFYTTYTYYTTSYAQDLAITDSRFETVTNIVTPTLLLSSLSSSSSLLIKDEQQQQQQEEELKNISNKNSIIIKTAPDFNLYFDDFKKIVDADGISTLYFSTQIIPTYLENGSTQEIHHSSSSLHIDEEKKKSLAVDDTINNNNSTRLHKTGLVRLIEGTRIANHTITHYQSKVIGTIIDNRYAQIIESTSSFILEENMLATIIPSNQIITAVEKSIEKSTINLQQQQQKQEEEEVEEEEIVEKLARETEIDTIINTTTEALDENKEKLATTVIRPFASRTRAQFAPKKKLLATIITRNDITPTITATPALKTSNRFGTLRRTTNNNNNNIERTSTRRFGNKPFKVTPIGTSGFAARNRLSSTRLTSLKRVSAIRPTTLSTNAYPRTSLKSTIRPTATLLLENKAITDSSTTTIESAVDSNNNVDEQQRRQQNPLLRFRRPPLRPSGFIATSQRNKTTTTTNNSSSSITTSTTTTPRTRSYIRPNVITTTNNLQNRARPQNNLFPPRGLFQNKQTKINEKKENSNEQIDDDEDDEETDADYEDEDAIDAVDATTYDDHNNNSKRRRRRRSEKRRIKRSSSDLHRTNFRSRFQRPTTTTPTTPTINTDNNESLNNAAVIVIPRNRLRYGARANTTTTTTTTLPPTTTIIISGIRPTRPLNGRKQFTLRDRDRDLNKMAASTKQRNSFRRRPPPQTAAGARRNPVSAASSKSNRRLSKSYGSNTNNQNIENRNRNSGLRGVVHRSRTTTTYEADNIGIITVTHVLPTEITLPVPNGKITELKQVISTKLSTEILTPKEYTTTVLGANGQVATILQRKITNTNLAGAMEITQFLLHETPTSTVVFTPTTIRGRRTSFSHILPSTVYSVENIVSTLPPQGLNANAPLANILLSQLLLGNIALPPQPTNPLALGLAQNGGGAAVAAVTTPTPITEYRTHTSSYVTTLFEGMSTVLPVTFQGKKIFTTIYDTTAQTITATEFITDTIVATPSVAPAAAVPPVINSLILQQLLQQQLQLQLNTALPATNLLLDNNLQEFDNNNNNNLLRNDQLDITYDNNAATFTTIIDEQNQNQQQQQKK